MPFLLGLDGATAGVERRASSADGGSSNLQHPWTVVLRACARNARHRVIARPVHQFAPSSGIGSGIGSSRVNTAGTPPAVINRLHAETVQSLKEPTVRQRFPDAKAFEPHARAGARFDLRELIRA